MARWEETTHKALRRPTVLAVALPARLLGRCHAVAWAAGAVVERCDVASCPTEAARLRPLVIVVPTEIHAFDPEGFESLAIAVGATLMPLEAGDTELAKLPSAIAGAPSSKPSGGRPAVIARLAPRRPRAPSRRRP